MELRNTRYPAECRRRQYERKAIRSLSLWFCETGIDSAQSKTLYMLGSTLHGNWESPCLSTRRKSGLHWEVQGHKPMTNGQRQSDGEIVPEKFPNNPQGAEGMEGRSPVKGNVPEHPSYRTQSRNEEMSSVLERIRKAVKRDKKAKSANLIRINAYTSRPETRAECGKPARSDP